MFTGLVQEIGEIRGTESREGGATGDIRLRVAFGAIDPARLGLRRGQPSLCLGGVAHEVEALLGAP